VGSPILKVWAILKFVDVCFPLFEKLWLSIAVACSIVRRQEICITLNVTRLNRKVFQVWEIIRNVSAGIPLRKIQISPQHTVTLGGSRLNMSSDILTTTAPSHEQHRPRTFHLICQHTIAPLRWVIQYTAAYTIPFIIWYCIIYSILPTPLRPGIGWLIKPPSIGAVWTRYQPVFEPSAWVCKYTGLVCPLNQTSDYDENVVLKATQLTNTEVYIAHTVIDNLKNISSPTQQLINHSVRENIKVQLTIERPRRTSPYIP
jgi:hypothetical protein